MIDISSWVQLFLNLTKLFKVVATWWRAEPEEEEPEQEAGPRRRLTAGEKRWERVAEPVVAACQGTRVQRHDEAVRYLRRKTSDLSQQAKKEKVDRLLEERKSWCCRRRLQHTAGSQWGRCSNKLKVHPWAIDLKKREHPGLRGSLRV